MSGTLFARKCVQAVVVTFVVFAALISAAVAAPISQFGSAAAAEPFGLATQIAPEGSISAKWRAVERAIEDDIKVIAQCRSDRANCSSAPALQFLKIVDDASGQVGLARVGEINRAINLAIRPMSDMAQYGVEDLWTSPLATLAAGAGDCEDYAIAKLVALREAGISQDDLRLVILRSLSNGEDHAVVAVRIEGHWRMLDNRYFLMLEDCDVAKVEPLFAIDAEGAKRFAPPSVAIASAADRRSPANTEENLTTSAIDASPALPAADILQISAM